MTQPFVSAVCITGMEPERVKRFLPVAIRCFHQQDYPADRRELIIVADGCFDLLPPSGANVKVVAVASKKSLGELRNIGLEAAESHSANLVIQWDEDWHHPQRMSTQVVVQQQQPDSPAILGRQVAYCFHRDVAFQREVWGHRTSMLGSDRVNLGIHGTIIHPVDPSKRYPPQALTEDTAFLNLWGGVAMLDNLPSLYVRFCHDGSVSGHDHVMREAARWPRGTWAIDEENDLANLRLALVACGVSAEPLAGPVAVAHADVPELVEEV